MSEIVLDFILQEIEIFLEGSFGNQGWCISIFYKALIVYVYVEVLLLVGQIDVMKGLK